MAVKPISLTTSGNNAQLQASDRQRQLALLLQNQALQPLEGGRMVGNHFVPSHPVQGVAKLGQMLAGKYGEHRADQRQKQMENEQRLAGVNNMQSFAKALKGTEEVHAVPPQGDPNNPDNPFIPATQYQAATPGMNRADAAMQHLVMSKNPMVAQLGASIYGDSLKEKKPLVVGKGDAVLDPSTNKELYKNTGGSDLDSNIQEIQQLHQVINTLPEGSPLRTSLEGRLNKISSQEDKSTNVTVVNEAALQTYGAEQMAKTYAPVYTEWRSGDKSSQVKSNLGNLKVAYKTLQENPQITGVLKGLMPDTVVAWNNPDLLKVKESVATVVQQNLKAILGGQFTEKEGENLIRRAFNPQLKAKENLRRIRLLIEQMESAAHQKERMAKYWEDNGFSLRGFKGGDVARSQFDHKTIFGALGKGDEGFVEVTLDADGKLVEGTPYKGKSNQSTPPPGFKVI